MAVGAHVELSPLAEAVPDTFCDDSSGASDIVVSGPVSTACEAADADGKMGPRQHAAAQAAEGTTVEQLRHEAARYEQTLTFVRLDACTRIKPGCSRGGPAVAVETNTDSARVDVCPTNCNSKAHRCRIDAEAPARESSIGSLPSQCRFCHVRRCLALGGPMSLQYIFGYGSTVISLIFVGHLGTFEMSAAVLGTSFSNVSGFALMAGLSSALETLCGQVVASLWANRTAVFFAPIRPQCCFLIAFQPADTLSVMDRRMAHGITRWWASVCSAACSSAWQRFWCCCLCGLTSSRS